MMMSCSETDRYTKAIQTALWLVLHHAPDVDHMHDPTTNKQTKKR